MNKQALKIFVVFTALVGLCAVLLIRVREPKLGAPGVKIGNAPLYGEKSNVVAKVSVSLPEKLPGFVADDPRATPITGLELSLLPPDTTFGRKRYVAADGSFDAQINAVLMGSDRSSIHPPEFCITGQGWQITGSELIHIPMKKPVPYELTALKLNTALNRRLRDGQWGQIHGIFIYWFVADGKMTPYRGQRMWMMAKELLTKGELQRWAYIAYFSTCAPGRENATFERLKGFIQESVPEFQITTGTENVNSGGQLSAENGRVEKTLSFR